MYIKTVVMGDYKDLVFIKRKTVRDTEQVRVFDCALTSTGDLAGNELSEIKFLLACFGVIDGSEVPTYRYGLIKHGKPEEGYGGFYPIPLVFARENEREKRAEELGSKSPQHGWINRRRRALLSALGIDDETAEHIDNYYLFNSKSQTSKNGRKVMVELIEELLADLAEKEPNYSFKANKSSLVTLNSLDNLILTEKDTFIYGTPVNKSICH